MGMGGLTYPIQSILHLRNVSTLFSPPLSLSSCPRHSLILLLLLAEREGLRTAHPLHGKQFKEREEVRRSTDVSDAIKGR